MHFILSSSVLYIFVYNIISVRMHAYIWMFNICVRVDWYIVKFILFIYFFFYTLSIMKIHKWISIVSCYEYKIYIWLYEMTLFCCNIIHFLFIIFTDLTSCVYVWCERITECYRKKIHHGISICMYDGRSVTGKYLV